MGKTDTRYHYYIGMRCSTHACKVLNKNDGTFMKRWLTQAELGVVHERSPYTGGGVRCAPSCTVARVRMMRSQVLDVGQATREQPLSRILRNDLRDLCPSDGHFDGAVAKRSARRIHALPHTSFCKGVQGTETGHASGHVGRGVHRNDCGGPRRRQPNEIRCASGV